jgi:hypothetical protein
MNTLRMNARTQDPTNGWLGLHRGISRKPLIFVALFTMFTLCFSLAPARTLYVQTTGNDANNGLSWANAKRTVQAALNASVSGDEVWVVRGTYVERINLKIGVGLYGGFSGTETDRIQRDWMINPVILDGSAAGSVVSVPIGAGATTALSGFVIRNGSATNGGGIYCVNASPIIQHNIIISNSALQRGGGIYCASGSAAPLIANNLIIRNRAMVSGGGVHCENALPQLINNTLANNSAYDGGGIAALNASPVVANTIITWNSSGLFRSGSGDFILMHNNVFNNGFYNYAGLADPTGSNGNLMANPLFENEAQDNYHLTAHSPCVDAGDDSFVQSDWQDVKGGLRTSGAGVDIGAFEFQSLPTIATPTFSPDAGTYNNVLQVTIQTTTPEAIIRYTTNGNDPTEDDPVVTGPVQVSSTMTLKARAFREGWYPSRVKSGIYILQAATPTFLPGASIYFSEQDVVINSTTPGAVIHYTTNGVDPTESDPVVSGPVHIGQNTTLKARAFRAGWTPSGVQSGVYILKVSQPTFSHSAGEYFTPQQVVITCSTPGTQIRYTTNGNEPVSSDPLVSGPVLVDRDMTLKAKAFRSGWTSSDTRSAVYDIVKVVYVKPDGNNNNDGLSWSTAKRNINVAMSVAGVEDIWVAAGTYFESLIMRDGVALYGGFAGNETDRAQRDRKANETVLDGNQTGRVIMILNCQTPRTRVDGFTIRNGRLGGGFGAGIFCEDSAPTIANNHITGNHTNGYGGGIYTNRSPARILNNVIVENSSQPSGGGIHINEARGDWVINNIIARNNAGQGSAIYINYQGGASIVNNTIVDNSSPVNNGAIAGAMNSAIFANNIVAFNTGGGIWTGGGTLRNNNVFGNTGYDYRGITSQTGTNGNSSVDPRLRDPQNGDYHLLSNSPCIGAGNNSFLQSGWRDTDGDPRLIGAQVDMGADEFLPDLNNDHCVNDQDLLAVLFVFGTTGNDLPEDLDGSGAVDDADLLAVLFYFGAGCEG